MRVGLVLGGGGVVGMAYHAGALAALAHDCSWDPRTADVIVGTSAGAVVGSLLRMGVPPHDLAAAVVGAEVHEAPDSLASTLGDQLELPPLRLRDLARRPSLPNLALLTSWAVRPWRVDPLGALVSVLPDGSLDLFEHVGELRPVFGEAWPADPLWLTAVRRRDLRRVVFGRDRTDVPLATAVAASCAVPGYFSPVLVDGDAYVDGGVASPTNADVLRALPADLDLVIVVAPMSGRELGARRVEHVVRRYGRHRLDTEVAALGRVGLPVVRLEPGPAVVDAIGTDLLRSEHLTEIVREAFLDTGALLHAPAHRALVAGLAAGPRAGATR